MTVGSLPPPGLALGCMSQCCYPEEYEKMFTSREARRSARRYMKRGLSGTERQLAEAVAETGIGESSVLDVGGGVGALAADLVRKGASRAVVVELSPSWESAAANLVDSLELDGLIDRRLGDAVEMAEDLEPVDVVVAHRVVCCYPEWRGLIGTMISKGGRVIGLTLPVYRWNTRMVNKLVNGMLTLIRRQFRTYIHPVSDILAEAAASGFHPVSSHKGMVWQTVVLLRAEG